MFVTAGCATASRSCRTTKSGDPSGTRNWTKSRRPWRNSRPSVKRRKTKRVSAIYITHTCIYIYVYKDTEYIFIDCFHSCFAAELLAKRQPLKTSEVYSDDEEEEEEDDDKSSVKSDRSSRSSSYDDDE